MLAGAEGSRPPVDNSEGGGVVDLLSTIVSDLVPITDRRQFYYGGTQSNGPILIFFQLAP